MKGIEPSQPAWKAGTLPLSYTRIFNLYKVVEDGGFEPPKAMLTDLQSAPFGRSGTLPCVRDKQKLIPVCGAGDGTRTRDLLITNQLLYQLSYTSIIFKNII